MKKMSDMPLNMSKYASSAQSIENTYLFHYNVVMMKISQGTNRTKHWVSSLWEQCFPEDTSAWLEWFLGERYDGEYVNLLSDTEPVAMAHMLPYTIMLNNRQINAVAMMGVCTLPEYRGRGYSRELIEYSLQRAYSDSYVLSFLRPFDYGFYEKYGYRCAYHISDYKVQYPQLAHSITAMDVSQKDISRIYTKAMQQYNGYVARDTDYVRTYLWQYICDGYEIHGFAIGDDQGYLIKDKKKKNEIHEMFFTGDIQEAYRALTIDYGHDLIIKNQPYVGEDSIGIHRQQRPHCMLRVIDFARMIEHMIFADSDIVVGVSDDIIQQNTNTYKIEAKNGVTSVLITEEVATISIDIASLSTRLAGYVDGSMTLGEYFATDMPISSRSFIYEEY